MKPLEIKKGQLSGLLKNLFAVAENYPDLKANQSFFTASTAGKLYREPDC